MYVEKPKSYSHLIGLRNQQRELVAALPAGQQKDNAMQKLIRYERMVREWRDDVSEFAS